MTCCGRLCGKINLSMIKKYKELNEDGKLKEKGTLIHGVKQGRFFAYEYFDKTEPKKEKLNEFLYTTLPGIPHIKRKTVGFYKDGLANGEFQIFENNILVEEGTFVDGLAQGGFREYRPHYPIKNNIINTTLSFLLREKSGISIEGTYKNGLFHGEIRFRGYPWGKGDVCIANFRDGLEEGTQKTLSTSGEIRKINNWRKGRLHGIEKNYDEDGRLEHLTTWKEGQLHGLEKIYDKDNRLEFLTTWKDGTQHGPYREREVYYDDYTGETDLTLERGMYVNGEKKGKYIKYFGFLPFTPKEGREDPSWERGVHEYLTHPTPTPFKPCRNSGESKAG